MMAGLNGRRGPVGFTEMLATVFGKSEPGKHELGFIGILAGLDGRKM
jgi:hypothetical protein